MTKVKRDGQLNVLTNIPLITLSSILYYYYYHHQYYKSYIYSILIIIYSIGIFIPFYVNLKTAYLNGSISYLFNMQNGLEWSKQVVFITGGSNGLGFELTKDILQMGAKTVVIVDKEECNITDDRLKYFNCDITNPDQLKDVCQNIINNYGSPSIVILNAGTFDAKYIVDATTYDFRNTLDVNFTSHLEILKAFIPAMAKRNDGHIVSIASILGELHASQAATYCASKAAVISLFQCMRIELTQAYTAPDVKTTLVIPGLLQTRLFGNVPHSICSKLPKCILDNILPSQNPKTLARRIVGNLERRRSGDIRMPILVHLSSYYNHLPRFVLDFLEYIIGVHTYIHHVREAIKKRND